MATWSIKNVLGALLLGGLPFTSALSYTTYQSDASFDEREDTADVGLYKSLLWSNFNISHPPPDSEDPDTGGLYPKDYWTDTTTAASTMACHDTLSVSLFGPAIISTNYFLSRVALFDLEAFSFGCLTMDPYTHKPSTLAQACTVAMRGYSPGPGFDYNNGGQNFWGVKPAKEATLWFTVPEDVGPKSKVRMVRMEHLDRSWWALGAITFEAAGAEGPVMLCIDEVKYKTYNVTKWSVGGIGRLVHENGS